MIGRPARILLGLVLLAQAGPVCACALEHALLCGGLDEAAADLARGLTGSSGCGGGDRDCGPLASCPGHSHHRATCAAPSQPGPTTPRTSDAGPAVVAFVPPPSQPVVPQGRVSDCGLPDLPFGSDRSLPLLI